MCKRKYSIFRNYLLLQEFGFFSFHKFLHKVPNSIQNLMKTKKKVFVLEDYLKTWQKSEFL